MRVEVTDADRRAAWPYAPHCFTGDPDPDVRDRWMCGVYDSNSLIQLLARHREAARIEGIRLGLEKAAKALDLVIIINGEDNPDWLDGVDHARTAIRAIDPAVIGAGQLPQRADSGR